MGLDDATDRDSMRTKPVVTTSPHPEVAAIPNGGEPTVTLSQRDRLQAETGLLFGLLALANGLIPQESLTRAFGAWALEPGRSFREVLVGHGHLDESGASLVDTLAERHLDQHHGIAWESLIALGKVVQFRFDPKEVADSELRVILGGFVAKGDGPRPPAQVGNEAGFGSRYEIVKHHASGGLGVVSLARDAEMRREVALKEIRPDCADNLDYRARFVREAEVTGRLEHPGIVPVYGIGHRDDGRPYYIMRFIRGETLKAAIARLHKPRGEGEDAGPADRLDLHALVGRFIDACHAVAYAHHRKVLHRDIKPINIMLGPYGETLVVDWGLAKSFDGPRTDEFSAEEGTLRPESGSELTPTRMGSQVGTSGYMSPEQAAGRLLELGPTSDIYSLGVTLHYLATGHAPFEGAGKEEFFRRVREGDFPRPCQVNPSVPRPLEAICLKAMALRPIDRYPSAEALVEDLERWRAGQPVLAYPEPPIDRLARWAKGHKAELAGTAVLMACLTLGLALFAVRERRDNRRNEALRIEAQAGWDAAKIERAASEASRKVALGFLKSTLREVAGADMTFLARSEKIRAEMAYRLVANYRELYRKAPDDQRVRFDLAQACQLDANIGRSMGTFDRSRVLYAEAIRLVESLGGWNAWPDDLQVELTQIHNDAGENLRMSGRPRQAEAEYQRGMETLRRSDDPLRREDVEARLHLDLSGILCDLGRFDRAKQSSRRAIDLLERLVSTPNAGRRERLLLVYARLVRAATDRLIGNFPAASTEMTEAARMAGDLMAGFPDPDTRFALAAVRNEQGYLLLAADPKGPADPAFRAFQEANSLLEPLHEALPGILEFQRSLAANLGGRASCHLAMKNLKEARLDATNARRLLDRLNDQTPGHYDILGQLGWTCTVLGRISKAEGLRDARDLMIQAVEYHEAALVANPDSPTEGKLRDESRDDLARIEEGSEISPPRP